MAHTTFDHLVGSRVRLTARESTIVGVLKDVYPWHHDDPCFVIATEGMGELPVRVVIGAFAISTE